MGLDMYLQGRLFQMTDWKHADMDERRHGKRVDSITVELGYWRKHPDLHGYIVNNFAHNAEDNCEPIELGRESIQAIMEAIKTDNLAHGTTGFFFGASYSPGSPEYEQQKEDDLVTFAEALKWLDERDREGSNHRANNKIGPQWFASVSYRASW